MPPQAFGYDPMVPEFTTITTTDSAMNVESTPSGTHWTPQDDTSEEQAIGGEIHTPQWSIDDGVPNEDVMTDLLQFDTQSTPFVAFGTDLSFANEQANAPQSTTNDLDGMESIYFARQGFDSDLRDDTRIVQDAFGSDMHTQTITPTFEATGQCPIDYQSSYAVGPGALETIPSNQSEGRPNYGWAYSEHSHLTVPRRMPQPGPWSAYRISDGMMKTEPSPEHLLFGPSSESPFPYTSLSRCQTPAVQLRRQSPFLSAVSASSPSRTSRSEGSDDTIDQPPPGNPVGPPPQFATKGEQRRKRRLLNPHQRANAALMRRVGACWPCALSKYPCFLNEGGKCCGKCERMRKKPDIWKCDGTPLTDLTGVFIPASLLCQHERGQLKAFCQEYVRRWTDNHLTVYVTWGYGRPIKCDVREIEPVGEQLLYQNQYRLNLATNQYDLHRIASPPLGIMMLNVGFWRQNLDGYLNNHLQMEFEGFPSTCFRGGACAVQKDLLYPMHALYMSSRDVDLPRLSLKLIVITHIMTHSLTLTEDTRMAISSMLINPPATPYEAQTCPRWLNKELKFLLSELHTDMMRKMLDLLHKNLRDGQEKKSLWAIAFMSIMTLAMVTESMQVSVRCKQETDKEMRVTPPENPKTEIDRMDERLDWLSEIFRQKYGNTENKSGKGRKAFNPLEEISDRLDLDQPAQTFAGDVDRIVERDRSFLETRRRLPGPPSNAKEPRTSRLVARFLLSLYKPRPVIMQP